MKVIFEFKNIISFGWHSHKCCFIISTIIYMFFKKFFFGIMSFQKHLLQMKIFLVVSFVICDLTKFFIKE